RAPAGRRCRMPGAPVRAQHDAQHGRRARPTDAGEARVGVTALDPALEDSIRRYEGALIRLHDVLEGLGDAAARRAPAKGWSVAQCLDHLVVAGTLTAAQIE